MKSKARSLSSLHDRKSKVALNCIIWAVHYKGRGLLYGIYWPGCIRKIRFNLCGNEGDEYMSNDKMSILRTGE